jgi:hypothetical protein
VERLHPALDLTYVLHGELRRGAALMKIWSVSKRSALLCLATAVLAGCTAGPTGQGALSNPPDNGGVSIEQALQTNAHGWIRGFIVARKGQPVQLCSALLPDHGQEPACGGASLVLTDHVLWRLPNNQTVFGSVQHGVLTDSMDDPENPNDARPCTYGPSLGPCAGYPYLRSTSAVIWSDHQYSVIGTIKDGHLLEIRELAP